MAFDALPAPDTMPANLAAEQAVLGLALYDNETIHAAHGLEARHFREPLHDALWSLLAESYAARRLVHPDLLAERLSAHPAYQGLGGLVYLYTLVEKAPASSTMSVYAAEVLDLATRRALIGAAREIEASTRAPGAIAIDQLHAAEKALTEIARSAGTPSAWISAGDVVASALRQAKASKGLPGLTTGLRELDDATGGLRRGVLTIIAGRPAMGKSSVALQIAKASAQAGKGSIFFSMEMPEFDLGLRMACDVANDPYAPYHRGRKDNPCYFDAAKGALDPSHWRRLDDAADEIRGWPLDLDVRPGLTVPQMLAAARRRIREWERRGIEPGCVIIDHLTIARPDQDRKGNKVAEVGDISRSMAEMAKTLDLPVVGLCQLSRDVEKRQSGDRRPNLSDLRWSGEIEQDARLVAFLYRPEYYVKKPEDPEDFEAATDFKAKMERVRHKLFWLIEKNNNGPTGEVETYCDIACSAIRNKLGTA